jgi:secreted PhoX family phosphatase
MEISKLSRRQFLGGAAAVVGAAVLPAIANVTPAAAMQGQTQTLPGTITNWTLDPVAAARQGYEIYKGKWAYQSA